MSSDENNGSGSPPHTSNGNGGNGAVLPSSLNVTTNGNGNGNGHGYPRSGTHSPNASRIEQRNMALLKLLDIDIGKAEMAPKLAAGKIMEGDREIEIMTNVYGLNHTKPLTVHAYHILLAKVTVARMYPIHGSKRRLPDYVAVMRRRFYQQIMPMFYQKYAKLFGDDANNNVLVDFANSLFSFADLSTGEKQQEEISLELTKEEASSLTRNASVSFSLKSANADFMGQSFSDVFRDLDSYDASVIRFTELGTSNNVAKNFEDNCMFDNNTTYFMNPTKYGYSAPPELGNGKFLAVGAAKSVILIERGDGTYSSYPEALRSKDDSLAAVVMDSKKTPFRLAEPLIDFVCRTLKITKNDQIRDEQICSIQQYFRDLTCHRTYANTAAGLVMKRLSTARANVEKVPEGKFAGLTIQEYYLQHYNITLQCPTWPLAEMVIRRKSIYFPIEVLQIASYQRVKSGLLFPDDIRQIIRASAVTPHKKIEEIERCYDAFNINGDAFCQNAGISVTEKPLKVTARVLAPPDIVYANGQVCPRDGSWRTPKAATYIRTSTCRKWIAVLLDYPYPRPFDVAKLADFAQEFAGENRTRGVIFAEPQDVCKIPANDESLQKVFFNAKQSGVEFILFGHPDSEVELHAHIKTLERKYLIITQCVRTSTIEKVVGKESKLTLENIVAKTNVKLGGQNYSIQLKNYNLDGKTLFIGFGVNHPGGGYMKGQDGVATDAAVSILGYSANDSREPGAFIGNFFVQPMYHDEQLTVLGEIMTEVLSRFVKNRGYAPSRVVVYRSGCSQGQFSRVLKYEVPVILHFMKQYAENAPLSLIVPSVTHNLRFFKTDISPVARSPEQNIPPGTVMDNGVVHSKFMEFYLNSHVAIQGTAKTPRYTILFTNEDAATLDMFQRWTNGLCYTYQIVNSPVSVPAPVYVANCYAERGRQIANNFALTKVTAEEEKMGLSFSAENDETTGKNEWVMKSYKYNFSCREILRDRRINA